MPRPALLRYREHLSAFSPSICETNSFVEQGVAEPLSIFVDSYGSVQQGKTDADLTEIIKKSECPVAQCLQSPRTDGTLLFATFADWDLRPGVIVKELGLQKAQYAQTAAYGHFGNASYAWEQPKKLNF